MSKDSKDSKTKGKEECWWKKGTKFDFKDDGEKFVLEKGSPRWKDDDEHWIFKFFGKREEGEKTDFEGVVDKWDGERLILKVKKMVEWKSDKMTGSEWSIPVDDVWKCKITNQEFEILEDSEYSFKKKLARC